MSLSGERQRHVEGKSRERAAIREEIEQLAKDRRAFIARETAKRASEPAGLADAFTAGLRSAAEMKGFRFE